MVSSFTIQNFRSILNLKLDFSYGEKKAPNRHQGLEIIPFIEAPGKQRMVPCMAFFGANASGKTNILRAFAALRELLQDGPALLDVYEPNLLNPKFRATAFALEFFIGADRFLYRISHTATEIQNETLLKNDEPIYAIENLTPTFSPQLLSPAYTTEKLTDILRVECSNGAGRQTKPFLHRVGLSYPGLHTDLQKVFLYFKNSLKIHSNETTIFLPVAVELLASVLNGDKKAALQQITDVVRRLDIDLTAINITETEIGPEKTPRYDTFIRHSPSTGTRYSLNITATHKDASGNPALLDFIKHESAGTQRLAGLVGLILYTLHTGAVFLVDELDRSLHPLLMREILLLFKKRRHNPKGAQLIFTTHNTDILDDTILRLSEIALVRKTPANGTLVRRLVDIKNAGEDIRNVTNFRKQYLAGFYSGIPHPSL